MNSDIWVNDSKVAIADSVKVWSLLLIEEPLEIGRMHNELLIEDNLNLQDHVLLIFFLNAVILRQQYINMV